MALGTTAAQLLKFIVAVAFFHGSEYALAVNFHGRSNVTLSSLLISKQYVIAMAFALLENMIEILLFPDLKNHWWVSNIGLVMVLIGEVIRKAAILTAGRAFTHIIRTYYDNRHELITHGIYRFFRHPGYCGFFIWAIGTQVMLCNPVCTVAFAVVTWRFFSKRIPYEEFFLRQFFGSQWDIFWFSRYTKLYDWLPKKLNVGKRKLICPAIITEKVETHNRRAVDE